MPRESCAPEALNGVFRRGFPAPAKNAMHPCIAPSGQIRSNPPVLGAASGGIKTVAGLKVIGHFGYHKPPEGTKCMNYLVLKKVTLAGLGLIVSLFNSICLAELESGECLVYGNVGTSKKPQIEKLGYGFVSAKFSAKEQDESYYSKGPLSEVMFMTTSHIMYKPAFDRKGNTIRFEAIGDLEVRCGKKISFKISRNELLSKPIRMSIRNYSDDQNNKFECYMDQKSYNVAISNGGFITDGCDFTVFNIETVKGGKLSDLVQSDPTNIFEDTDQEISEEIYLGSDEKNPLKPNLKNKCGFRKKNGIENGFIIVECDNLELDENNEVKIASGTISSFIDQKGHKRLGKTGKPIVAGVVTKYYKPDETLNGKWKVVIETTQARFDVVKKMLNREFDSPQ
ncbi:MAG: hypothetical protein M0R33_06325 [Methylomonas sp.]|uniref:hypothetical protein n=1 Tax=Methylomonas sp. TaxID=418 RepID=UPI0025E625EE|nr:hypothetical protein [Methylomonas sp.]MCK9606053.1 hypothetical protein [Methylomonas sp.]